MEDNRNFRAEQVDQTSSCDVEMDSSELKENHSESQPLDFSVRSRTPPATNGDYSSVQSRTPPATNGDYRGTGASPKSQYHSDPSISARHKVIHRYSEPSHDEGSSDGHRFLGAQPSSVSDVLNFDFKNSRPQSYSPVLSGPHVLSGNGVFPSTSTAYNSQSTASADLWKLAPAFGVPQNPTLGSEVIRQLQSNPSLFAHLHKALRDSHQKYLPEPHFPFSSPTRNSPSPPDLLPPARKNETSTDELSNRQKSLYLYGMNGNSLPIINQALSVALPRQEEVSRPPNLSADANHVASTSPLDDFGRHSFGMQPLNIPGKALEYEVQIMQDSHDRYAHFRSKMLKKLMEKKCRRIKGTKIDASDPSLAHVGKNLVSGPPETGTVGNVDSAVEGENQTAGHFSNRGRGRRNSGQGERDEAYYERRRKNNEAAKRSRDARRVKEEEIAIRAAYLEEENMKLRMQLASMAERRDLYNRLL